MAEATGQAALAPEQALANAFESVLTESEQAAEQAQAPKEAPAAPAANAEEAKPDDATAEKPAEEAQPAETEETETIELDPEAELFETEFETPEGKQKSRLSLNELQHGYMRQQDYTRKTQEVARQREEVQAQVRQGIEATQKAVVERLQQFQSLMVKTVAPELTNVDWNKLAAEDPAEYVRLSNRANQVSQALQAVQQEIQTSSKTQEEEQNKSRVERIEKSKKLLEDAIPGWGNEKYQQVLQGAVQRYGFSLDEIAGQVDGRYIHMAHDALKYRELQSAKPAVAKKVAIAPKVVKPGTRSTGTPDKGRESLQNLRKTGKPEDLQGFFEARL